MSDDDDDNDLDHEDHNHDNIDKNNDKDNNNKDNQEEDNHNTNYLTKITTVKTSKLFFLGWYFLHYVGYFKDLYYYTL